jgi:hypothetical protein
VIALAASLALSGATPASAATPDPCSLVTPDQLAAAGASGTSTQSMRGVFGAECFILHGGSIAGAVKQALVTRYDIGASRLGTIGYGASRPKASNATDAGRTLNRRVELVRR